jgi:predicted ATPase/DNA-binding SARP family transcriptional activator/Flp pilus assembly protein TadD
MAHLTINVLGTFQVLLDGIPVQSFESDKVRALLAYLTVEADHPHPRAALIGLLWPDCTEETARHNFRQALFNLRLALGDHTAKPPYLLISRSSIQLNPESDHSIDIAQFNEIFNAWAKRRGQSDAGESILLKLQEMVDLYRGEFLQHFYVGDSTEFEDWMVIQREMTRQRIMDALVYLSNEHAWLGEYESARRYAARQLELDPWREEAHCQLMRVLALDGQRSAALAQYENCKKVLVEEFGVEPSAETRDLYEQIRQSTLKPKDQPHKQTPVTPVHNIPIPITPFFGREQELIDLSRLFADPTWRCITLAGPGGIGKTHLALQAADQHKYQFAHGSAFVPLASVASVEAVIPTIANAVRFAFYGSNDPKAQLLNYLSDKQMLLVMDNVEHLLMVTAEQVTIAELFVEILQQAPGIKLLITSREALDIQGEWLLEIQGLSFPKKDRLDPLEKFSAVALFMQRARRAQPTFVLSEEDQDAVVRICNLVGGMPLALEIAAAWVKVLSPAEIALEIGKSLDFLQTQMRDVPERHRSMRAIFDHSWQTLSHGEQQTLRKLSVFRGGFQRQAAEQVTGTSLPTVSSLMTRSLLRRTSDGRYDMHELIQQYAATKLAEDPDEMQSIQERHSLYYLGLLEENDSQLRGRDQQNVLTELTREIDNIRAAWDWSVSNQRFLSIHRVSFTLCYMFALHNWFAEGEVTFWKTSQAIAACMQQTGQNDHLQETVLHAMLSHCGYFRLRLGKGEEAYTVLAPSAAFLRTSTESSAAIYSLWYLGFAYLQLGRFVEAKESLLESHRLSQQYDEDWFQALADEFLGSLARGEGTYSQAQLYLKDSLAHFRQLGDPMMTSHVLSDLGHIMQKLGDLDQAEKLLQEGLEIARELDYCRFGVGTALDGLGQVAYARGDYEKAGAFFLESATLFQQIGDTHRLTQVLNYQGFNALALDAMSDAQNYFCTALKLARQGGLIPSMLDALMGLAMLDAGQRTEEEILTLVLYILQHPASAQDTKKRAAQLKVEFQTKLPPERIEVAGKKARSKNLEEFVRQFQFAV